MADEDGGVFVFPLQKLKYIDENVQQILAKCENQSCEDVVDELATECEVEALLEEREKCFSLAKQTLEEVLKRDGTISDDERLDIQCVRRTNKTVKKNIAKEIMEMFQYIVGYSKVFPRHVLTKSSKLVESAGAGDTGDKVRVNEKQEMKITDKMRLIELQNTVNELCGKLDGVMVENRTMKERLQALENEMDEMKKTRRDIDTVQNPNREVPTNEIPIVTANTDKGQDNKNESKKQDGGGDGEDEDDSSDGDGSNGGEGGEAESSDDSEIPCAQPSPKRKEQSIHYNVMDENGMDWQTVIGKKQSSQRNRRDDKNAEAPRGSAQPSTSRLPGSGQTTQAGKQKQKVTYSQIVKNLRTERPERAERQERPQRPARNTQSSKNTMLRGIKQERSVALYLKSIAVTDEKDEEIGRSVKEYASKRGIRVMGFHVIRYKACVDAVGCKIFVPESQQHEALVQDVWPQNITCRRWERPDVWQERSRRDVKRRYEERQREERGQYDRGYGYGDYEYDYEFNENYGRSR